MNHYRALAYLNALFWEAPCSALSPWWIWAGGVLAAVYFAIPIIVVPRVVVSALLAFAVLEILAASMVIDHLLRCVSPELCCERAVPR